MCKAWKWAMVEVQREVRSFKVLKTVLGSLAFTLGGIGSHGRILSRRVSRSDLSLKFTLLYGLRREAVLRCVYLSANGYKYKCAWVSLGVSPDLAYGGDSVNIYGTHGSGH